MLLVKSWGSTGFIFFIFGKNCLLFIHSKIPGVWMDCFPIRCFFIFQCCDKIQKGFLIFTIQFLYTTSWLIWHPCSILSVKPFSSLLPICSFSFPLEKIDSSDFCSDWKFSKNRVLKTSLGFLTLYWMETSVLSLDDGTISAWVVGTYTCLMSLSLLDFRHSFVSYVIVLIL